MAKKRVKRQKKTNKVRFAFFKNRQNQFVISLIIMILALLWLLAMLSYFKTGYADQSILTELPDKEVKAQNWLGKFGASISHFFIYKGFGIGSMLLPLMLFLTGLYIFLRIKFIKLLNTWTIAIAAMIWLALLFGFLALGNSLLAGTVGYELNEYLQSYIGKPGIIALLLVSLLAFIIFRFKLTPEHVQAVIPKKKEQSGFEVSDTLQGSSEAEENELEVYTHKEEIISDESTATGIEIKKDDELELEITEKKDDISIDISKIVDEKHEKENLSDKLLKDFGEFDPKLELSNYKFPTLDLLKDYHESIAVNSEELQQNKDKIVQTLKNYNIGISHIKATVGPTVTLYEIIPQAGIRISKIKNLEDDIALSLSALGIRIIAPIPGKGTIGIEVPNKNPSIVSMRSVIASAKFQKSEMELPIAFGKTISNETFVVDLAKMPHLLMAGATGQGKSVGLNAAITSLLYKKHPAEIKFVLVDPKKVELTLYSKIERHFLAKLPGEEEAIITDITKVVNTLNSLCIEMDDRYDLLKKAFVRNIKEYNAKFKERQLNPENGHRFLPYIILVIDEFADLIMTAGKEIETPIARLAQLARAIGIHLIIATQRPSVNVITGIIKANFPARIAFRVTSKIDSRTILDGQGADQLIGKGDMLYSGRSELIRLQCAFVDTPEVDKITEYIGAQKAYPHAYELPEYTGEDSDNKLDYDIEDRDELFKEAALIIVNAQQGSASLLQRKLKLGYNRAGRIIDQLEAAGIVGPFEGSKARQVLFPDQLSLKQFLENEKNI